MFTSATRVFLGDGAPGVGLLRAQFRAQLTGGEPGLTKFRVQSSKHSFALGKGNASEKWQMTWNPWSWTWGTGR